MRAPLPKDAKGRQPGHDYEKDNDSQVRRLADGCGRGEEERAARFEEKKDTRVV